MPAPPDWFTNMLGQEAQSRRIEINGCEAHYLHWANPGKPGLLFVHGHGAHARWWDFIAPAFAGDCDVVAIDLSGAGDSGHRERYSAAGFVEEIMGVAMAAGLDRPTLVGHSFGGAMVRIAAYLHPEAWRGIVLVDSALPTARSARKAPATPRKKTRHYDTLEAGMRRFRLRPPQPATNGYIIEHIARHSLKETPDGFMFKFDQAMFAKMPEKTDFPPASQMVGELRVPASLIYGERSRFFPDDVVRQLKELFPGERLRAIPDAHHHVFLDQPLLFIDALRSLMGVAGRSPSNS